MSARPVLYGEEFNTLVINHGITCEYEPAIVCDCITKDSNQPSYVCPKCGGSGYRYLPKQTIKVIVTSFASRTEQEVISMRESGTAYATPQSDIIMGFHDRLTFPDFKCKYSERLWIRPDETVTSKTYRNLKDVIMICHGNIQFEKDVDYKISKDGYHIEFSKPIGELIDGEDVEYNEDGSLPLSILYYTVPSYLVADILHELRSHYTIRYTPTEKFEELPKQYRLKREDFIYDVNNGEHISDSTDSSTSDSSISDSSDGLFD